jgi:hypothetical protein
MLNKWKILTKLQTTKLRKKKEKRKNTVKSVSGIPGTNIMP